MLARVTPRAPGSPGPVLTTLGVLTGLASLALGVGLLRRADSALGGVGAALFLVCALVVLNSYAGLLLARFVLPVPRREHPARGEVVLTRLGTLHLIAQTNLLLLGGWFAALGVVGGVTESWGGPSSRSSRRSTSWPSRSSSWRAGSGPAAYVSPTRTWSTSTSACAASWHSPTSST